MINSEKSSSPHKKVINSIILSKKIFLLLLLFSSTIHSKNGDIIEDAVNLCDHIILLKTDSRDNNIGEGIEKLNDNDTSIVRGALISILSIGALIVNEKDKATLYGRFYKDYPDYLAKNYDNIYQQRNSKAAPTSRDVFNGLVEQLRTYNAKQFNFIKGTLEQTLINQQEKRLNNKKQELKRSSSISRTWSRLSFRKKTDSEKPKVEIKLIDGDYIKAIFWLFDIAWTTHTGYKVKS